MDSWQIALNETNGTGDILRSDFQFYTNTIFTSIWAVLGLLMFAENVLIILLISTTPELQTTSYLFIVSLAVADTLVSSSLAIACFAAFFANESTIDAISTFTFLATISVNLMSLVSLAVVAIERYVFITKPIFYRAKISRRVVYVTIAATWFFVLCNLFITCGLVFLEGIDNIISNYALLYYSSSVCMSVYIISVVIVFLAYGKICLLALQQRRVVRPAEVSISVIGGVSNTSAIDSMGRKRSKRWKGLLKSVKFFATVFGMYLIITMPGMVVYCVAYSIDIDITLYNVLTKMIPLNSGTNFFILIVMNMQFRKALKRLCCTQH